MSDRYLFRGKRTDNGEWVVGYYFYMVHTDDRHAHHFIIPLGADSSIGMPIEKIQVEVDPSTICQCTGVPDRNKTLIYENDVVRTSGDECGVIRFGRYGDEKTDYGYYVEWEKSQPYWRNDIYFWQSELRVIGSVIDNPELLEVGE